MLDKLHDLAARIGISPKVLDPILAAVILYVANGLISDNWDLSELKTAVAAVLLTAVSVLAPPATAVTQAEVDELSARKRGGGTTLATPADTRRARPEGGGRARP